MTQYQEDPNWLVYILNKICPYCDNSIIKKGIKRSCDSCGFSMLGNPKFLNYKKVEKIYKSQEELNIIQRYCPECGSPPYIDILHKFIVHFNYIEVKITKRLIHRDKSRDEKSLFKMWIGTKAPHKAWVMEDG